MKENEPFEYVLDDMPYADDVQIRIPDISKAKRLLDYEATSSLEEMLDEIIPWIKDQIALGNI